MAMDTVLVDQPYSDEWYFRRLFDEFNRKERRRDESIKSRIQWAEYLWKWYLGDPELPIHMQGWQAQVTKDVLKMGRANLAMLAVDSKLDRIQLEAFKTADIADDENASEGNPDATARRLMVKYGSVFDDALLYASVMNDGYIWLGNPGEDGLPTVTAEDPRACVTIDDPVDPTRVIAALKMYRNDIEKLDYAHVVLPKRAAVKDPETGEVIEAELGWRIRVATRPSRNGTMSASWSAGGWDWNDEASGELPIQSRGPLVHHVAAPNGIGDIEPVLDLLMRINNMLVDRLWVSKFQTFRQRAMQEKVDPSNPDAADPMPETDPETGEKIDWDEILSADPGAVWRLPVGMTIWESTPTDIQGALLAIRDDIKEFAAVTRTPIYVFTPDAVSGSATGAGLAREGQVNKAKKWIKRHTRVFLSVCADMLAIAGFEEEAKSELELKWGPVEKVTLAERAQAGNQAKAAGVPQESVWEDWMQVSPETVQRYKQQKKAEEARALLFAPAGGPPAPAPARPEDLDTPVPPAAPRPGPNDDLTRGLTL